MPLIEEDIKEKIKIDSRLVTDVREEGQVIVHCTFHHNYGFEYGPIGIRVWKSTFLIDDATGVKTPLIRAYDICYQPQWIFILPGQAKSFTMVFEALPKTCKSFTFKEVIPQSGAFVVKGIRRSKSDVYRIRLS